MFFSRGGAAPRGNLIPVRGSCCSGEGAIDSATAQRPVWPQPNRAALSYLKNKNKQKKNHPEIAIIIVSGYGKCHYVEKRQENNAAKMRIALLNNALLLHGPCASAEDSQLPDAGGSGSPAGTGGFGKV